MHRITRKLFIFLIFLAFLFAVLLYFKSKVKIDAKNIFISPLIRKDQQYSFYLSEYHPENLKNPFSNPKTNSSLYLYFMSEADCPAIELTFFTTTNSLTRRIIDPCFKISRSGDLPISSGPFRLDGHSFSYKSAAFPANNITLLIARSLFASTRIAIASSDGKQLPEQKDSYPQIPAEFFVTSF